MRHIPLRILTFVTILLFIQVSQAAPEGHFRGQLGNQMASADLELLDSSLIGILVIGQSRYLVSASLEGEAFNGSASDMLNGEQLSLNIRSKSGGIFVHLNAGTSAATRIELLHAR